MYAKSKGGEDQGLFEIKIKELNQKKEELMKCIEDGEKEWIDKKTSQVEMENLYNIVNDECLDKKSKQTILFQKKSRLENQCLIHEK
jgi:hypothetical protein